MPSSSRSNARTLFRRRVRESMKRADEAFRGEYRDEINALLGLSRADIDQLRPGTTDLDAYDRLVEVVKEASRVNLEQAELARRIRELGELAVRIASKVPRLAAILG